MDEINEEIFNFELGEDCDADEEIDEEDLEELIPIIKKEKHWKSEKLKESKGIAS